MIKKQNQKLEGLRGICALSVALSHILTSNFIFKHISIWLSYLHFAHISVLTFFVLSGYVIDTSYPDPSFNKWAYLKKRVLRIYPIYLFIVSLCLFLEPGLTLKIAIQNLLFLQSSQNNLKSNPVIWSIQYEVIYYILFIVVIENQKYFWQIFASLTGIACMFWVKTGWNQQLGGIISGFIIWLCGYLISRMPQNNSKDSKLGFLFFILSLYVFNHLSPGTMLMNMLGLNNDKRDIVSFADLFLLPVCFILIVEITNKAVHTIIKKLIFAYLIITPIVIFVYLTFMQRIFENERWVISLIAFLLSILTLKKATNYNLLEKASFLGGISYAIYLVHFPIAIAIGYAFTTNSLVINILLFFTWLLITLLFSFFLEYKYQQQLKKVINSWKIG